MYIGLVVAVAVVISTVVIITCSSIFVLHRFTSFANLPLYAGHLNGASRRIRQYGTNEVRYIIKRNQYMQCHKIIFIYADINECDEHPCGNNTCNNELGGVTCECNLGYRGTYCEENIDDCLTSICQNNSTCVDGINEYSCICPPNYKGDLCETLFCEHINKHITHVYNL